MKESNSPKIVSRKNQTKYKLESYIVQRRLSKPERLKAHNIQYLVLGRIKK